MERFIHTGVYRTLRKLGAAREEIMLNAKLNDLFEIDEVEWNCFMFFLESRFNISFNRNEELKMITVEDTIVAVNNKLNQTTRMLVRKMDFSAEVA